MNYKITQYGGALFSNACSKCGEVCKMPKDISVNHFMTEHLEDEPHKVSGVCKEHGQTDLSFIGWGE